MKIRTKTEQARRAGISLTTLANWRRKPEFPEADASGAIDSTAFDKFAAEQLRRAAAAQTGEHGDLKRAKLLRQCKLLDLSIQQATRADEIDRIEHEAKRKLWYSVDQVTEFAKLVVAAFDVAHEAVGQITRDPKVSEAVQTEFDRVRRQLAAQVRGIVP
jgi:hypothetical protein